jgi:hypothetical protein
MNLLVFGVKNKKVQEVILSDESVFAVATMRTVRSACINECEWRQLTCVRKDDACGRSVLSDSSVETVPFFTAESQID